MTQPIAGAPNEAMKYFVEQRRGFVAPPMVKVKPRPIRTDVPKVNEPGISEHPTWAVREPSARKRRIRAESMKRRLEYERSRRTPEKVGKMFRAKHPGRCELCRKRFAENTMIAKAHPKGYVHEDCSNPYVARDQAKQMTPSRESIRAAIAKSRFAPREAG